MAAGYADLVDVMVNIGKVVPTAIMMCQGIAALIGLYLTASALVELWGVTHDNALKYVAGRQRFSVGSACVQLVIGSILLAIGTLEWMGIMSRTLTGDYANSRMLSYSSSGSTLQAQAQLATLALLGIMQVVGFIAMVKGWLTVNGYYNNQTQAGLGTASGWIIGGILAWNFKWFSDVLNNTIGFNLVGLFTPWS
ncbi:MULTISPECIES: type IV secretion protein DotIE [Pseudomonas]|uniref:Intracellular multiplication protein IcmC n=1 Tax=Pseudomonas hunanensis TaxID=1247546 RepID=A0ACC6K0X1_9PSED|nr:MULTISPECIES: type IV secretion protein DotIE [Pseudomonas]MBP2260257.1 intracellular multiplication protein IcmC [Pseudomonas sp. BP8]MDR6712109.1 intracellular multiplication protein IcmC [Pseudomonas hunanensis]HDS1733937.1 type IV secretion protein DotIE [Pseudomonas putida]